MRLEPQDVSLITFIVALATLIALGYDSTLERVFVAISATWLGVNQGTRVRKGR